MKYFRSLFSYYVVIIIASLVPVVLFGVFTYQNEKNSYEVKTLENLKNINKNKNQEIVEYLDKIKFDVGEFKNTISFLQEQAIKNISNIQLLQKRNILLYYSSLEKNILSLSKKDTYQYAFSFLNRGKTISPEYLADIYNYKQELGIKSVLMINKKGKIVYASDEKNLIATEVQDLTPSFAKVFKEIQNIHYDAKNSVYIVPFAYDKKVKRYREFIISPFRDVKGFVAFEIDQNPIQTIVENVKSLGATAETYLVYKDDTNGTRLASDRKIKKGKIGDAKNNKYIEKGFQEKGVDIKYGSTGAIELVGYMPVHFKNINYTMQTTVKYIEIISPKIQNQDYFQKFVKDYNYANLLLISSKGKVIYSVKQTELLEQNILKNPRLRSSFLASNVRALLHAKRYRLTNIVHDVKDRSKLLQYALTSIMEKNKGVEIVAVLRLNIQTLIDILSKGSTNYYNTLSNMIVLQDATRINNLAHSFDKQGEVLQVNSVVHYDLLNWKLLTQIDKVELEAMTEALKREIIVFIVIFSIVAVVLMLLVSYYKKQQDAKLFNMATHDTLTQLPNRRFVFDIIEYVIAKAKRNNSRGAVLFMDLDNFKFINDSYGHETGDFVLVEISKRLKRLLRENDVLARLGGDEFLVIVEEFKTLKEIDGLCSRIIDMVSQPIEDGKKHYQVGVSIGIATFPDDSVEAKELLQFADTAMYKTKEQGRNHFTYYSIEMTQKSQDAARVEAELKRAIENDELVLYYQPQINIQTNKLIGVEALVRWRHPQDGLIMPNNFIPIAEESTLILDLGEWVTKKACSTFKSWKTVGYGLEYIAVNMSAKQLVCKKCTEGVKAIINDKNFNAAWLELEITENSLIENFDIVSKNIERFKELGIKFSIDDFGTGYSSLAYLKSLKISTLKIDRAFIKDILYDNDDLSIVKAIIEMGHALGYQIIAEGAEEKAEVDLLRSLGCDVVQGYYFSKPLSELDLLEFMDSFGKNE